MSPGYVWGMVSREFGGCIGIPSIRELREYTTTERQIVSEALWGLGL